MDGRRVQVDVEAVVDALEYGGFVDIVVAGVDYADSIRPALLGGSDGCPQDSLAAASCVAVAVSATHTTVVDFRAYQNGWKKPTMPLHSASAVPPFTALPTCEGTIFSQSSSSLVFSLCSASKLLVSAATLASKRSLLVVEDRRRRRPKSSASMWKTLGSNIAEIAIATTGARRITRSAMVGDSSVGINSKKKNGSN